MHCVWLLFMINYRHSITISTVEYHFSFISGYIRMPAKTNKERQREFRERRNNDLEKRQAYLKKKKEKYWLDLESKKRKPIGDVTEREQRRQRKKWRKNNRRTEEEESDYP